MAWLWTFFVAVEISLGAGFAHASEPAQFRKSTLKIGSQVIKVELAESVPQQQRGLMFRRSLKDNEGMLFIFPDLRDRAFWMKNTFVDLAIGYFDADKKLIDVKEMKAVESMMVENPPNYPSSGPAQFALEVPKGWFTKHQIKVGTKFSLSGN